MEESTSVTTKSANVLIISSAGEAESITINADFAARLQHASNDALLVRVVHYNDVGFIFEPGRPKVFLLDEKRTPLTQFDVVFFKSHTALLEQAAAIADCAQAANIPLVGEELLGAVSETKLSQYARLSAADFPVPKSVYVAPTHLAEQYDLFVQELGTPFILKDIGGYGGNFNFLIQDEAQYKQVLADCPDILFVAQQFIRNTGDLRVLVIGGEVKLVILRERHDDSTHLNNTSQGARSRLLTIEELGAEANQLSVRAARLFKRDITGVDVMFESETKRPYILEINAHPQIGSGSFVDEKAAVIAEYLFSRTSH